MCTGEADAVVGQETVLRVGAGAKGIILFAQVAVHVGGGVR